MFHLKTRKWARMDAGLTERENKIKICFTELAVIERPFKKKKKKLISKSGLVFPKTFSISCSTPRVVYDFDSEKN